LLPARPPAYLIERIAAPGAGASLGSFYRITAIGFGSHASTQVVLQSVVRKPKPAAADGGGDQGNGTEATPPVDLPAGRIGWREIPNWPRLHAQATE
jgi:type IV pilus assembly protein PilX